MEEKELIQILLNKCYRFLAIRPRSEQEILRYLRKKQLSEDINKKVLTTLKEMKLVDDAEFTRWWIEERSFHRQKGVYILKKELLDKGISAEIIGQVIENEPVDETELATKALISKTKMLQRVNQTEQLNKAVLFLQRRGFSYEVAKKAFEEWRILRYNKSNL